MELHEFEERFERAILAFQEQGEKYALAKSQSWLLQEQRKVVLAKEMSQHNGSEASKERLALSSEAYRIHLEGTAQAIHEELKLKTGYERLQYQIEAYRSLSSLEKAQMNIR
jgi:hypothetical protein